MEMRFLCSRCYRYSVHIVKKTSFSDLDLCVQDLMNRADKVEDPITANDKAWALTLKDLISICKQEHDSE